MGWLLLAAKQKVHYVSIFPHMYVDDNQNSFRFIHMCSSFFFRIYLVLNSVYLGLELNRWLHSQLQV